MACGKNIWLLLSKGVAITKQMVCLYLTCGSVTLIQVHTRSQSEIKDPNIKQLPCLASVKLSIVFILPCKISYNVLAHYFQ